MGWSLALFEYGGQAVAARAWALLLGDEAALALGEKDVPGPLELRGAFQAGQVGIGGGPISMPKVDQRSIDAAIRKVGHPVSLIVRQHIAAVLPPELRVVGAWAWDVVLVVFFGRAGVDDSVADL
jgi:hypothetical protein